MGSEMCIRDSTRSPSDKALLARQPLLMRARVPERAEDSGKVPTQEEEGGERADDDQVDSGEVGALSLIHI